LPIVEQRLGRIGLGFFQLQLEALVFLAQALYECAIAIATAGLQFCAQCFALLLAGGQALFEGIVLRLLRGSRLGLLGLQVKRQQCK
jgi:hypothetical protein